VVRCYSYDVSRLLDICRQTIAFDTVDDLVQCLRAIVDDGDVRVVRIKNRLDMGYDSGESAGYRDVAINLWVCNSTTGRFGLDTHVCEVQLMLTQFASVKAEDGHKR